MHVQEDFRVQPYRPSGLKHIELSTLAQTMVRSWTRNVAFFKMKDGASPDNVTESLRKGLSCVLVEIPFLAGKVVVQDTQRGWVTCEMGENEHAVLRSRDLSGDEGLSVMGIKSFDELESQGFPQSRLRDSLLQPTELSQADADKRVLMAQANFIPGGMLLMTAFHHSSVDGGIRATVYKRWGHWCVLASTGQLLEPQPPSPRLLDAMIFSSQSAIAPVNPENKYRVITHEEMQSKNPMSYWMNQGKKPAQIVSVMFAIDRTQLDQLKTAARPLEGSKLWISTMDALVSLTWRCVTRCRMASGRTIPTTKLGLAINVRNRIDEVPNGFLGVGAGILLISASPDDIAGGILSDSLRKTALKLRQKIEEFEAEHFYAELAFIESSNDIRKVKTDVKPHLGPDLIITDSRDTFKSAAGSWGPELGGSLATRKFPSVIEGVVAINNIRSDGGLEFEIPLETSCMDKLCHDQEFMSFVSVRSR